MALKIHDLRKLKAPAEPVRVVSIPTGTVFAGKLGETRRMEGIYLRLGGSHSCGLISLTELKYFWSDAEALVVYDYEELDATLTVGKPQNPAGAER